MATKVTNQYLPDYLVTPGEVLQDYLEACGMSQAELSDRTGMAKKTINEIVKGKAPLSTDTALKLERALGRPAHFWSNLERQYQEDFTRLAEKARLEFYLDWLKKIPVNAMAKLGWLNNPKDKLQLLEEVLCFFGIASPEQWEVIWRDYQVDYRQTQRFTTVAESVSAWLRKGELEAQQVSCNPFNKKAFQEALEAVRGLTREDPKVFVPRLIGLCASAGVAVVFVPELPKTGVAGATRWIGDKAVIQLSLRYKSNDQLWFTFFHEAGHIIKHGRKDIFVEGNGLDGEKEQEANQFARDHLIPVSKYRQFLTCWDRRALAPVESFAQEIGIAPGIVIGRLQFEKLLHTSIGNKLKVFYTWE